MSAQKVISKYLGYQFKDIDLLNLALTHKSYSQKNNEKLEFFGDSVLSMVISELLINMYPEFNEGELSLYRASLVQREVLNELAESLCIDKVMILGEGESTDGNSIAGNGLEAILAAIYLDSNFKACKEVILKLFLSRLEKLQLKEDIKDPKTTLQEYLQKKKINLPQYTRKNSNVNAKEFKVVCVIKELKIESNGYGSNTHKAEMDAAREALKLIVDS